jgi:hypothetical protein
MKKFGALTMNFGKVMLVMLLYIVSFSVLASCLNSCKAIKPSTGQQPGSNMQVSSSQTPNLVQGGNFERGDYNKWTISNITPGVTVRFGGGRALYRGGNGGQAAIYQAIQVEANQKYQINMRVSGHGGTDMWFEVYAGKAEPQIGQDYNDGGKRLALNTWNGCGKTPFNAPLTQLSCEGAARGVIQFPTSGTVYLLIKSGGGDLGTTGISLANVELRAIQ